MAHELREDLARAGLPASTFARDTARELPAATRVGREVFGRFARIASGAVAG